MRRPAQLLAVAASASVLSLTGVSVAAAQTVADYAGQGDNQVGDQPAVRGAGVVQPEADVRGAVTTLPFTGGEVVLIAVAGGTAVAAGAAMVVGGRRRSGAES